MPMLLPRAALLLGLAGSSWYVSQNYRVSGLQGLRLEPRGASTGLPSTDPYTPAALPTETLVREASFPSIGGNVGGEILPESDNVAARVAAMRPLHVATFNLQGYGRTKADKPQVVDQVARLCRQFEVVALQGIIGPDPDLLPKLVEAINRGGARYDYLEGSLRQRVRLAFVFDTDRVQTDRRQLYTVADPANAMEIDPLVGWFRAAGVPTHQAWTFSMVNVWIDPNRAAVETPLLPAMYRAILADGRQEDDVIIAGSFALDRARIEPLVNTFQYTSAAVGVATDVQHQLAHEHLLVPLQQQGEYTLRAGTIDFLRLFNLSLAEATEISDRVPVWAEFTATEAIPETPES